ncbi:MAG: hypothetical protein M9962_09290 [Oligoflexia bacterium]|nr:hypothetical protein [Oligoflexia bacterium]
MKAFAQILGFSALMLVGTAGSLWASGFVATDVNSSEIIVSGKSDGLKAGDSLYHSVSPFRFTIRDIKGDRVSLEVPSSHSVKVGDAFLKSPSANIQKGIETQQKLMKALED